MKAARVVVYAPARIYSIAERVARDASVMYAGVCSVDVLVLPVLDDRFESSVVTEGGECGLMVAELIQSMLWVIEAMGVLPEPFETIHVNAAVEAGSEGSVAA